MEIDVDNPNSEPSTAPLDSNTAAAAFNDFLEPPKEKSNEALEAEALAELTAKAETPETEPEPEPEEEADSPEDAKVTIEVDGKMIELSKAELAEAYKNGLRQADYTQKTMATAEARKTAEAETARFQSERTQYAQNLVKMAAQLEGALTEQNKIDFDALLEADPVEYLKQRDLLDKRQQAYQQTMQQQRHLGEQMKAEQQQAYQSNLQSQRQELLVKLPDWKDPAKAQAEQAAIRTYLLKQGFDEAALSNISDHKAVILGRKAMLYDQMMGKAQAAAKKVQTLPTRVMRSGDGNAPNLSSRTSLMQRLGKTGRQEDAAALFASMY